MAVSAPTPCRARGCAALVRDGSGYCERHRKERHKEVDGRRESASKRGYGYRWQQYRLKYLRANPLCVVCRKLGYVVEASVVDHITPHCGDHRLFWKPDNHQALCAPCHSRKTASEDGGFGNRRAG
ncbi:HNH endonuclease [Chromobacterium haemolyticum]|uniref:Putative HNH nuclease YajD n=1 Tax=Chromobacterium fluminis TaxID=3044269 RepID=A0ABX0L822_9NEIS|nr:HNH endonuclease [Chromobacterium haemolyticum]NHR07972.1 HNH endonuclease [Chromobacterium haemolyticum]